MVSFEVSLSACLLCELCPLFWLLCFLNTKLIKIFHNPLDHRQLNWTKKIKIGRYRQKHLLRFKSFSF